MKMVALKWNANDTQNFATTAFKYIGITLHMAIWPKIVKIVRTFGLR